MSTEHGIPTTSLFLLEQRLSVQGPFAVQENQSLNLENNQNAKLAKLDFPQQHLCIDSFWVTNLH